MFRDSSGCWISFSEGSLGGGGRGKVGFRCPGSVEGGLGRGRAVWIGLWYTVVDGVVVVVVDVVERSVEKCGGNRLLKVAVEWKMPLEGSKSGWIFTVVDGAAVGASVGGSVSGATVGANVTIRRIQRGWTPPSQYPSAPHFSLETVPSSSS